MHIAVDGRNLVSELSGLARYLIEITAALSARGHEITLLMPGPPAAGTQLPAKAQLDIARFPGPIGRLFWSASVLPARAKKLHADVFWGPAHRLPPWLPASLPRVLTIHDLVWRRAPETMRFKGLIAERLLMGPAIRKADIVCAVSQATADDIAEFYSAVRGRIRLVPPPVNSLAARSDVAASGAPFDEPYVLFVGTFEPRKNIAGLIGAFARLPEAVRAANRLVLCGGKGWRSESPLALAAQAGVADRVTVMGRTGDTGLAALYAHARGLALPSFFEGFGLPIVEAQRFGLPVLTSDRSSMPEVAGEGALFADPYDTGAIASALERLLCDDALHAELSKKALSNSARFSAEKSAVAMEEALDQAIALRGARR
jgi:glycosyltransferase involved in cell wall biosynthesis